MQKQRIPSYSLVQFSPESTLLSQDVPEWQRSLNDLLTVGSRVLVERRVKGQGRMFMQYEPACHKITAVPRHAFGWYMVESEDGSTHRYEREEKMKFSRLISMILDLYF